MTVEETVDAIADKLVTTIQGLEVQSKVKAYKWAVNRGAGFDSIPAAVVQIPSIGRTRVDQSEDHLGQRDLYLDYQVIFVFDPTDVNFTMPQAVSTISTFIDAVDLAPDLGLPGRCQEAKVTNAEPSDVTTDGGKPLYGYVATAEVLAFL